MQKLHHHRVPTRAHSFTNIAIMRVERFLHIEATSGIILIIAAIAALIWANSTNGQGYIDFWNTQLGISFGTFSLSWNLHFWVNDILMTFFFLVAGMEIRREIHEGALSNFKQASLPLIAALGGVFMPAIIYSVINFDPTRHHGWAIPTATDIAFAVGILALLGRSIPSNIRVILLSLAIIDDVIAVLIIALFYSSGIEVYSLAICALAIILIFNMQWMGIANAWLYSIPGAILWWGLYKTGVHPSLAGVILGMLTSVLPETSKQAPIERLQAAISSLTREENKDEIDYDAINHELKEIQISQRKILPPVTRVQMVLHHWVAFGIMPLFAFANAGVAFSGLDLGHNGAIMVMIGVTLGLFIGKPLGIFLATFIAVKLGICRLPPNVTWSGIALIGLLAGIGFTMSIFVAMLAFQDQNLLASAKVAVLLGSFLSAICGLIFGFYYKRRL